MAGLPSSRVLTGLWGASTWGAGPSGVGLLLATSGRAGLWSLASSVAASWDLIFSFLSMLTRIPGGGVKGWKLGTSNWELGARKEELGTGNWEPVLGNWESVIWSQELETSNWELGAKNWEPVTGNWEPSTGN